MEMRKLISMAIVFGMLSVSFAMVAPKAKAEFITTTGVPWTATFTPMDVTWDSSGIYCVVVGQQLSAGGNAWVQNVYTKMWQQITSIPTTQILTGVAWDEYSQVFWICGDTTGAPPSTIYIMPGTGHVASTAPGASLPTVGITAIEADNIGNW